MLEEYFVAKKRLYPQSVKGKIRSLKSKLNIFFLSFYCLMPFLRFDRGTRASNQAILIDIPGSKIYFFFIEIWPQEIYYLAGILIIAAITLFFVTSLFGRIWCGYACFQTVWTDIFIAIERIFQGDRNERILLDRKNKSFQKIWRKTATHLCWILVSLVTGFVFVSYFNDAILLLQNLLQFKIPLKAVLWILGIASATYIMAGFAREHVCTFMCPYSRFQSAMFDDNTLTISYDQKRGEPRGKMAADKDFTDRGHCIDCKQCVVVCPVGIDIRQGLQMECIACGLCIDACDGVMEKIGLPKGLIRYDTLAHLNDPIPQKKFRFFRFRTFYYSAILLFVCAIMLKSLIFKAKIESEISSQRNPIFVVLSDGSIRNDYTLKVFNKTHQDKIFRLEVEKSNSTNNSAILKIPEEENNFLKVKAESIANFKVYITLPNTETKVFEDGRQIIELILSEVPLSEISLDGEEIKSKNSSKSLNEGSSKSFSRTFSQKIPAIFISK